MGRSRTILNYLASDLQAYIDDTSVTFDVYRLSPAELETQASVKGRTRIALYEAGERQIERVDAFKAGMAETTYAIDISVQRAYANDPAPDAELILADYRDWVVDWAYSLDAGAVTGEGLYNFGYLDASSITRLDIYATQTLRFVAKKDLLTSQKTSTP